MNRRRLILGAGIHRRDGWMTLDANPQRRADFVASIPPLPAAVRAEIWQDVEWIHGITSVYPWEAKQILTEIHSVLEPGGRLTLEQPDFDKAKARVEWIFGAAGDFRDPLLMNRWAYTPETLSLLLAETGFSRVAVLPAVHHVPERDFRIEAYA